MNRFIFHRVKSTVFPIPVGVKFQVDDVESNPSLEGQPRKHRQSALHMKEQSLLRATARMGHVSILVLQIVTRSSFWIQCQ